MTQEQSLRAAATSEARELTVRALVAGVLMAVNVYAGLKIAIVDSGNVTAAILGFAIFAAFRGSRRYGPLENNITATVASSAAMMPAAAGMIGPIVALV